VPSLDGDWCVFLVRPSPPHHPDTVEISDPMGVNAESVNFVTKTGIIIRVIELRVCALQRRQSINELIS
jgi:hypothetical protein